MSQDRDLSTEEIRVDAVELQKENVELKEQIRLLKNEVEALKSLEREFISAINASA